MNDAVHQAQHYLALVRSGDADLAADYLMSLLASGVSFETVLADVIGGSQREVGRLWEENEWSVADEHAATSVTENVLAIVSYEARRRAESARRRRRGGEPARVVVACTEREWHVLPARMAATLLTWHGLDVTFLGPSVPPTHLASYLEVTRPVGCAFSCSVLSHLPSLRRSVDVAHEAGLPVIVGGSPLGRTPTRSEALGADAWTGDLSTVTELFTAWAALRPDVGRRPSRRPHGDDVEQALLEAAVLEQPAGDLVNDVLDELLLRFPRIAGFSSAQLERTREDVVHIFQHCGAALTVNDPEVFFDFTDWLMRLLAPRGVPASTVMASYEAIIAVARNRIPNAALLIDTAMDVYG